VKRRRRTQTAPVQARKRRFRLPAPHPLTDGCLVTGGLILFMLVCFALFIGWDYLDRLRYDRVTARILSVETSCLFERRSGGRSPTITRSAEFPCAEGAERRASGQRGELIRFLTVAYRYTSPRDGMSYSGTLHREAIDFPQDVRAGGTMPVYSRTSDPGRSRGLYQWPVD
jgi:hypothetical protein